MKKSALLAVSALSLGVVGLATFTPVVNAVTSTTGDATVQVHVQESLAIGETPINPDQENQTVDMSMMNVNFGPVKAGEVATKQTKTVAINNNSGKAGTLSISATDPNLSDDAGHTIPAGNSIQAGTSAWGYSLDSGSTYKAVTTSPAPLGSDSGAEQKTYTVDFGLSTAKTQASGDYDGTVTYTYAIN